MSPQLLHLILRDRVVVVVIIDCVVVVIVIIVGLIMMDRLQKLRRRRQRLILMDPVQTVCIVSPQKGLVGLLLLLLLVVLLLLLMLLLLVKAVHVGQVLQVVNHLLQGHPDREDPRWWRHRVEQLGGVVGGGVGASAGAATVRDDLDVWGR